MAPVGFMDYVGSVFPYLGACDCRRLRMTRASRPRLPPFLLKWEFPKIRGTLWGSP